MKGFRELAGLDVDDVLLLHAQGVCDMSNGLYNTDLLVADYRNNWAEMWGIGEVEAEARRIEMIGNGLFENLKPVSEAREMLERMAATDIGMIAITNRRESLREVTEASLKLYFGDLISAVELATYFDENGNKITRKKSEICHRLGVRSLTDDLQATCIEVAKSGIDALHFGDNGWPELETQHPQLIRAKTWAHVGEYFGI